MVTVNNKDYGNNPLDGLEYQQRLESLAYKVGKEGGVMPTIFNASNEEAVKLFINKKIKFLDIETIIIDCVSNFKNIINPSLNQIIEVDLKVRDYINNKYCN